MGSLVFSLLDFMESFYIFTLMSISNYTTMVAKPWLPVPTK